MRLHNGLGEPILQYVLGNSILTPEETSLLPVVFTDEYSKKAEDGTTFTPDTLPRTIQKIFNLDNKMVEPILKAMQLQSKINSYYHFQNQHQFRYISQPYIQPHTSFTSNPLSFGNHTISHQRSIPLNYEGVSGFKVEICLSCLAIIITAILDETLNFECDHKCISGTESVIMRLGPKRYFFDLSRELDKFPDLLFNQCKKWANNTSGQLYLVAKKIQSSHESQNKKCDIQANNDALPFLNKNLAESKVMLNDTNLYEFLKLAKNGTNAVVTFRGKPGQENIKYILTISTV